MCGWGTAVLGDFFLFAHDLGSDSKESACSVGDLGVQSLGQEDPLKKEMATHSSVLVWEIPRKEKPGIYSPWGHKETDRTERLTLS